MPMMVYGRVCAHDQAELERSPSLWVSEQVLYTWVSKWWYSPFLTLFPNQ